MTYIFDIIISEWKDIVKRGVWALSVPIISIIYALLNKDRGWINIVETSVDKHIPFTKYFIIPYVSWYLYVGFFLMLLCVVNEKSYRGLLINLLIGMIISYIIFYVFPTTVPRPIINSKDIFSRLVLIIYNRDNPYNCFPSIHVINAALTAIYVNRESKLNRVIKGISTTVSILIILSTMFIKQHYFLDAVAGILIAYTLYITDFLLRYKKFMKKNAEGAVEA